MKITYSAIIKNKSRGNRSWTGRVRENGKVLDLTLNTESKEVADAWVASCRKTLELVNSMLEQGVEIPPELSSKIVHAVKDSSQVNRVTDSTAPTVRRVVEEYLNSLAVTGRRSSTIDVYRRAYRVIFRGMEEEPMSSIDPATVSRLLAQFADRTDNHRRNMSNRIREFLQYYADAYDVDIKKSIKAAVPVKVDDKEVAYWTAEEMTRIINSTANESTRLYFATLASTGMRHSEAYCVEFRDLHDGCIFLRAETTKGRRGRTVPLTAELFNRLSNLRTGRSQEARVFRDVPSTQSGRHGALQRAIDSANSKSRPENQIMHGGLHQFRRSASILLYKSSHLDIKTVASILGHSPQVSLRYYQAARSVEDTVVAVRAAIDESSLRLPDSLDWAVENDLI